MFFIFCLFHNAIVVIINNLNTVIFQACVYRMENVLDSKKVKGYGSEAGASVVGIASADDFSLALEGFRPSDVLENCRSVIVFGSPFPQEAILGDPDGYIDVRNAMSNKMNDIAKNVAKRIRGDGYKAITVNGLSGKWVNGITYGAISLKHAAELAGIGRIGRNYLLISPEYGTLLWLSAVVTDAALTPDEKISYSFCDGCSKCVDACPSKALDDPSSFAKKKCTGTMFKMVNKEWKILCFLCRKVCPHRFGRTV